MKVKSTANIRGLKPVMKAAIQKIDTLYLTVFDEVGTLTSGTDGEHKMHSKHYTGEAIDMRIKDLPELMAKALRLSLGRHFDVVVEEDHFHIEYDPKA